MTSILLALAIFAGLARAYDNGAANEPPRGWSSWCTNDLCGLRDKCTEWEVRNKADAMVAQGLTALGYKWILLDDCWSDHERDANGELQPAPKQFPSGIPALADYLHSIGMKLGLYTCVGTQTCKKNRPGSYGFYETDAKTMAKWGVDMVKADYCNKPANTDGRQLYSQFSRALNATGRPILFATCNWGDDDIVASGWGAEVAQMYRVQMDHLPMWHWPPTASGQGLGAGVRDIIEYMALLDPSRYVRANAWMDPDFLETLMAAEPAGCPLPRRDAQLCATMNFVASRTEFAFWALWSAPLLVSTDVANLSAEKRSILTNTEVLAIHNDEAWVGGSRVFNHSTSGAQVWARPLANGDIAVILYNAGRTKESWEERETVPVSVTWDMLRPVPSSQRPGQLAVTDSQRAEGGGASRSDSQQANDDNKAWSKSDKVKVRDLWAGTDLTGTGGQRVGFEAQIAPKDHMMLRLSLVV